MSIEVRERFLGCLLGCAVGDALGAPYEGYWSESIPGEEQLLAGFAEVEGYPLGQYTDDTQLSVATVRAVVEEGDVVPDAIARAIAALWKEARVVGPGGACSRAALQFLKKGDWRTCGAPVGQAGNGTAMRTAVLGLFFLRQPDGLAEAAANVSRITHQDPRSIAGGVAVARAAQWLATEPFDPDRFCAAVAEAMTPYEPAFAQQVRNLPALASLPEKALEAIAWAGQSVEEFPAPIITPFVIPTVLASFWCVLCHPTSWGRAVAQAIRLGGDVDTLGAIVGALQGARLGLSAIPSHLVDTVLDRDELLALAARYQALVAPPR